MEDNDKINIKVPTSLPPGWELTPLENISTVIMGQSPPSSTYNDEGKGLPFFQGKAEFDELYPVPVKWCSDPNKIAQKDDVLMSVRAPVGPTNLAPSECCIGRGLAAIRPAQGIPSKYILYYLRGIESEIDSLGTGTTFKAILGGTLRQLQIALAPQNQRQLIVAEIEKQFSRLDEAVANLKRVKANLKRYKAAVLKAAVEGKLTEEWRRAHSEVEPADELLKRILIERKKEWVAENPGKKYNETAESDTSKLIELPSGWVWSRSDQLFNYVTSGSRGWARYYSESGAAFLRMGNLDHDTIDLDLSDIQRVQPPKGAEGSRTRVLPGDILISITADVGMVGIVPADFEEAYINQHVALARPATATNHGYLAWYLAGKNGQDQLQKLQRGATKVGLGLDDIKSVDVPLPPAEEQNAIVAEVERRFSLIREIEVQVDINLKRSESLRQAVLAQAFKGSLLQLN